jgi:hypothetical protein
MNIAFTIDGIRELVNSFDGQSKTERLYTYAATRVLLEEISEHAQHWEENGNAVPNAQIHIGELVTPLRCLARIDDNGHNDLQNSSWVREGLEKLLSKDCFDVQYYKPSQKSI